MPVPHEARAIQKRGDFVKLSILPAEPRRRFKRFELHTEAYVSWKSPEGKHIFATGITRDVSTHGAFITGKSCPEQRTVVTVELPLSLAGAVRRMKLRGRVLRTEAFDGEDMYGFAVYADRQFSMLSVSRPAMEQRRKLPAKAS